MLFFWCVFLTRPIENLTLQREQEIFSPNFLLTEKEVLNGVEMMMSSQISIQGSMRMQRIIRLQLRSGKHIKKKEVY